MDIQLLYQDADLAVVNKPSGLSLFADRQSPDSLWDLLKQRFAGQKIYQVHRIDKGTSGVLLVALSRRAQAALNQQFQARQIDKVYLALCVGEFQPPQGLIDLPLCPGRKSRYRIAGPREAIYLDTQDPACARWRLPPSALLDKKNFPSQSYYDTVLSLDGISLLAVKPITGRTHQIRVHCAWLGHPLLGEHLYGRAQDAAQQASRLALHSYQLKGRQSWNQDRELQVCAEVPDFFLPFCRGLTAAELQTQIDQSLKRLRDLAQHTPSKQSRTRT